MEMHSEMEQASVVAPQANDAGTDGVSRRGFIKTISVAGAGLAAAQVANAAPSTPAKPAVKSAPKPAPAPPKLADIRVAIIGPGNQGRNLLTQCLRIEGVRFVAVCDIWDYSRTYAANILKKFGQPVNVYE